MEWDDLRFFLAVARDGSLSSAAAKLRASASTVSRRIEQLETALGVKLFSHHQTGYALTDEGEALLHRAQSVEDEIFSLERDAIGQRSNAEGLVRLATAENIANHIIIPTLPRLRERHPGIVIELVTGIRSINLTKREADLALRLRRPDQGNVAIRKLGVQAYALYGSSDYVGARQTSNDEARYENDRFIVWAEEYASLPMSQWIETVLQGRPPALIAHSLYAHLAAARAGLGLAVLPCFLGDTTAGLERVSSPIESVAQEIWLVIHRDLRASARVRVVAEFLAELVNEKADMFLGKAGP